jgi:hypothetical protein
MGLLVLSFSNRMDTNTSVTISGEMVERGVLLQEGAMICSDGGH